MATDETVVEFQKLYDYVMLTGKHINQIYNRLEVIEKRVDEIRLNHNNFVAKNMKEMTSIRENMLNKSEFDDFVEKMKTSVTERLPPLPELVKDKPRSEDEPHQTTTK